MPQSTEQPKIDDLKRLLRRLEQVSPDKEIVVRPSTSAVGEEGAGRAAATPSPVLAELAAANASGAAHGSGKSRPEAVRITPPPLPPQRTADAVVAVPAAPVPVAAAARSGVPVPLILASAALVSVAAAVGVWTMRDHFVPPLSGVPSTQLAAARPVAADAERGAHQAVQATAQSIVAANPPAPLPARSEEPRLVAPPQPATPPAAAATVTSPAPSLAAQTSPPTSEAAKGTSLGESPVMRAQPVSPGRDKFEAEARLEAYLERGQKLVDEGDLTAARAFFRRAAESGDPRGALALGMTYDVNYFAELGIRGVSADSTAAGEWYRKAMDLGSKEALDRLERLPQQ